LQELRITIQYRRTISAIRTFFNAGFALRPIFQPLGTCGRKGRRAASSNVRHVPVSASLPVRNYKDNKKAIATNMSNIRNIFGLFE